MNRTLLLALRDLCLVVGAAVLALVAIAACAIGLFVLCLHVLARLMW